MVSGLWALPARRPKGEVSPRARIFGFVFSWSMAGAPSAGFGAPSAMSFGLTGSSFVLGGGAQAARSRASCTSFALNSAVSSARFFRGGAAGSGGAGNVPGACVMRSSMRRTITWAPAWRYW
jgi:hypothetical protein